MAQAIGLIGPAISLGSSLLGMAKGTPAQRVNLPQPTQYPGIQLPSTIAAANELMTGSKALQGQVADLYGGLYNYGQGTLANIYNNPGMAGYTGGAATAADIGRAAALAQYGLGGNLAGAGGALLMSGFDPRGELYSRTAQELQERVRAGQAARGIAMAPWGAGLENKAFSDFAIDWQNQQLQRQIAAAAAAGQAYQGGAGLMGGAAPLYLQSSAMPYGAFQQIYGNQLGALGQLGGLYGQGTAAANIPLQNYADYMRAGITAGGAAANYANEAARNQLYQAQLGFNQQQTMGQQFGQALQGIQKGWPAISSALGWGGGGGTGWAPGVGATGPVPTYA